jgi:hypothetical protein
MLWEGDCETCVELREKLTEEILAKSQIKCIEKPVPEWMQKLGVTKIEVERGNQNEKLLSTDNG